MILVVGGAGYIGSHTNKGLARLHKETVVYDNLIYGHRESVKWGIFEEGDLCDSLRLEEVFSKYPIEAVIHFAAYAYVGESVTEPAKYYRNNVCNTVNLLDAMLRHNVKTIVFSSTCATYGIPETVPITEDMPQNPINPYGSSKLMIERIFSDYCAAYGLSYLCLRYFNAAGADPECEIGEDHQPETHLIPLVLDAADGKRDAVNVFGTDYPTQDGSCVRDYIHVTDLAGAHILALEHLASGGKSACVNLGTGSGSSVLQIIQAAEKITGKKINVCYGARRPGDPAILVGSNSMAKKMLGWNPRYTEIETILRHAWNWHLRQNKNAM